jgi:hypothetical protein
MAAEAFRGAGFDACRWPAGCSAGTTRAAPLVPEDGTVADH